MRIADLLKPEVLRKIANIEIRARGVVDGYLAGRNRSRTTGGGASFREYRPYTPGDEPRGIDWKLLARTDKFYVRRFEAETAVDAYLVLDHSGSMAYGAPLSKFEFAATLAASFAYLLKLASDRLGLITFTDRIDDLLRPQGSHAHFRRILSVLTGTQCGGLSDFANVAAEIGRVVKKRAMFFFMGDLYPDLRVPVDGALGALAARGHDVAVFHLLDRNEITMENVKAAVLRDMEDGRTVPFGGKSARGEYVARVVAWRTDLSARLRMAGVDYVPVDTSDSLDALIGDYLLRRRR